MMDLPYSLNIQNVILFLNITPNPKTQTEKLMNFKKTGSGSFRTEDLMSKAPMSCITKQ